AAARSDLQRDVGVRGVGGGVACGAVPTRLRRLGTQRPGRATGVAARSVGALRRRAVIMAAGGARGVRSTAGGLGQGTQLDRRELRRKLAVIGAQVGLEELVGQLRLA